MGIGTKNFAAPSITVLLMETVCRSVAHAQAAPQTDQIQEIVVTAQKREQKAQDVGISIDALSAEQLQQLGATQVTDLARFTPGANLAGSFAGQYLFFSIRGVSQQDFSSTAEGPNAVYVDDGYIGINNISAVGLFDVDHSEVLKGPQGTLFGRNAVGGLVNIATAGPSDTFNGYANYTYGSYNSQRVEAALGGPINSTASFRLAGLYNSNNDWITNVSPSGGHLGGQSDWGVRAKLKLQPSDSLDVLITGFATHLSASWAPYFLQNVATNSTLTSAEVTTVPGLFGPNSDVAKLIVDAPFAQSRGDFQAMQGLQLKSNYDLGNRLILTWITDFKAYDSQVDIDNFPNETPPNHDITSADATNFHSLSQELRAYKAWDKAKWTTGFYYLHLDTHLTDVEDWNGLVPGFVAQDYAQQKTTAYAVFSQMEWNFAPLWTLVTGLRYTRDEKTFDLAENLGSVALRGPLETGQSVGLWTGKAQLEFRPVDHVLIYGGYNRGAKAGGFNVPLAGGTPPSDAQIPYKPETMNAYEIGFKLDTWQNRMRLNGAVFSYDYNDSQAVEFAPPLNPFVVNANARTKGAELEVQLIPLTGLTLSASGSYIDNRVDDINIVGVIKDRTDSYTAKWQSQLLARYEWPFLGGTLAIQADTHFQGLSYFSLANFSSDRIDPYWVTGARLSWQDQHGRWSGALSAENLTDRRYISVGYDAFTLGGEQVAYGKPRWISVNIARHF